MSVMALAAAGLAATTSSAGRSDAVTPPSVDFSKLPGLQTSPPPWNSGFQHLNDRLPRLGLSALSTEGKKLHIHSHLDVFINGKAATVPAHVGIQVRIGPKAYITELHTHLPDGIIHVESPKRQLFTLGQFFGEWGVRLTNRCIGRSCGTVHWWVNGHPRTGNPAALVIRSHEEIAVAYGKPPAAVPKTFAFPAGY
jgi:hypothetical protein